MPAAKAFTSALNTQILQSRASRAPQPPQPSPRSNEETSISNGSESDCVTPITPAFKEIDTQFFGRGVISDLWLRSRLIGNGADPHTASSFRSQGEVRPTTLRNAWAAIRLLPLIAPGAVRICARGQPVAFTVMLLDYLADAILPLVSIVTYAQIFDLVQDALMGVEVPLARIWRVAATPLAFKIAREIWDYIIRKVHLSVKDRIKGNFQEIYLIRQLYTELSDLSDPYVKAVFYESEVMVGFAEWLSPTGNQSSAGPSACINSILRAISTVLESTLSTCLMAWTLKRSVAADPTSNSSLMFMTLAIAPMLLEALLRFGRLYEPEGKSPAASQELKAETSLVSDLGRNGPYKQEVLIYSLQEFVLSRWRALRLKGLEHRQEQQKLAPLITALTCLHHVASVGLYVIIALYHSQLSITLGAFRLYQNLNDRISNTVWITTYHCKKAFQHIFVLAAFVIFVGLEPPQHVTRHLIDKKTTHFGDEDEKHPPPSTGPMRIEARNLCFSYPGADKPILKDVNLTIEPGQSVAIVGSNGGGKTTLIKVLMGLYKPTGTLLIDGVSVTELSSTELHARSACLFQDFSKYPLTLAENVGLGYADLSLPALYDAIVKGGADGVLSKVGLDGRLNTTETPEYEASTAREGSAAAAAMPADSKEAQAALIKGSSLSGGQWQRVALARAFLKAASADLVVFDEPSSALDPQAEADLFERIHRLAHGADGHRATTIYVSHRFATVRSADKIAVVEDGTIVEFGSHSELMERGGRYKELFEISAKVFK